MPLQHIPTRMESSPWVRGSPTTPRPAALLDADINPGCAYTYTLRRRVLSGLGGSGYIAYRADVVGSDAVAVVNDGQDREMIEAVERDCDLLGTVIRREIAA